MKNNKKLFIGLLALSAFLGACAFGTAVKPVNVTDIPLSWFEENRGEGERLVYVTVERATELNSGIADAELYIATDNTAIANLTAPAKRIDGAYLIGLTVQDSIKINNRGLAVFSLPKSQDTIGLAYLCDADTRSKEYYEELAAKGVVTTISEVTYSNGHITYKIDPGAGDIAIKVQLRPNEAFRTRTIGAVLQDTTSKDEGSFRIQTTTSNDAIKQMIAECSRYGAPFYGAKSTPGFIAAPAPAK